MSTRLIQVLTFTNVAPSATVAQAHQINVNGTATKPDLVAADTSGFTITADATQVSVTNNNPDPTTVHVWLERKHTTPRELGALANLSPQPFVFAAGGGGGGGSSVFVAGAGAGSAIQNNSSGNASTGIDSTVCGQNNQLSGQASFAEGFENVETVSVSGPGAVANHLEGYQNAINVAQPDAGGFNHVEGNQNALTATGTGGCDFNHVEGNRCTLTTLDAFVEFNHVEGDGVSLTATSPMQCSFNHVEGSGSALTNVSDSHVEGYGHTIDTHGGTENHIEGDSHVIGDGVLEIDTIHVEGRENVVQAAATRTANTCHVEGHGAGGIMRETQRAKASGQFAVAGDAQMCDLVMRGSTPGAGAGESVELLFGRPANRMLELEDNKGYQITVNAVAKAGALMQTFKQTFAVRRTAGVTTIAQAGAQEALGDAGAASWTFAASVGVGPDRFALTFTTGATTNAARCVATVEWTEVFAV